MLVFPHTKRLNAVIATDQAASLVMMSAGTARPLGVPSGPPGDRRRWRGVNRFQMVSGAATPSGIR